MKAILSRNPGGPETLTLEELPTPTPQNGEVLIRIRAAGVNFPDTLIIRDLYQIKPQRPFSPGGEVAGEVEAIGKGVTHLAPGDRVLAMGACGGFASHMIAPNSQVVKIPDAMPFEEAACFILTYGTSYHALKNRADIKPGETILILGAAGGVGVAAIELAKASGARVIAAVSSKEKACFCRDVGADETIIYARDMADAKTQKEFSNHIRAAAGGDGVNVVYDAVGGDYAEPALRTLAWKGRYLVVGFPAGIPKIPLNLTLLKGTQILGVFWGAHVAQESSLHQQNVTDLFQLYAMGKIRPRISARFPLEDISQALGQLQDRKVMGKIVLNVA